MSLLALLAGSAAGPATPKPPLLNDDSTLNAQGYTWPASAPYNPSTYLQVITPDGTGAVVHPDVIDMQGRTPTGTWQGFRFWMCVTPYWNSNYWLENPTILCSNNGIDWFPPAGDTNRYLYTAGIVVPTGQAPALSDNDLTYDPDTDGLVMVFREHASYTPYREVLFAVRSPDGKTWGAPTPIFDTVSAGSSVHELSPAVVRRNAGDWLMFTCDDGTLKRRTATDPLGTWSAASNCTLSGSPANPWHQDVILDTTSGHLYGLLNYQWNLCPAKSTDGGLTWTVGAAVISSRTGQWDQQVYRGTLQPKGANAFRIWYSANGPQNWRMGYTEVPRSLWATL